MRQLVIFAFSGHYQYTPTQLRNFWANGNRDLFTSCVNHNERLPTSLQSPNEVGHEVY